MLLDSIASNAAMIGSSPETATMVVSRRMLDDLDRNETQGVLAQLIGSAETATSASRSRSSRSSRRIVC